MAKLSKAQQEVMDKVKADIDYARTHTLREWAIKETGYTDECIEKMVANAYKYRMTPEGMRESCEDRISQYMESYGEYYEDEKNGVALTGNVNSRTLYKLQEMGLIEIIQDGKTFGGIDTIKVLNY